MARRGGSALGPRIILLILAVVCFAIVAFGIDLDLGGVNLGALGLALFAASFIVP